MTNHLKESNVLLCGSSRVGKSTLINAICQQQLTKCSESLNSLTKVIEKYSYQCSNGTLTHQTNIWDTPGIESWSEIDFQTSIKSFIEQTKPLSLIYCASPSSFALLNHLKWLVEECHRRNIFCALVCTNMWAGRNRQEIVNEFCQILNQVHPNIQSTNEDGIIYYDHCALVTMVNSKEYVDEDFGVRKPASGVDQLIFGIGKCLNRELMFAWFRSVSQNKSFWTNMSSKLTGLFQIPSVNLDSFFDNADKFFNFLFDFDDEYSPSTTDTEEYLFHDAEIIDMPDNAQSPRLIFTFQSDDAKRMVELGQTLAQLGAKTCKTEQLKTEYDHLLKVTAEFENVEDMKKIHSIWNVATATQGNCTMVDPTSSS